MRLIQLSDTHVSAQHRMFEPNIEATAAWLRETMVDNLALLVEQKVTPEECLRTMAAEVQRLLPR